MTIKQYNPAAWMVAAALLLGACAGAGGETQAAAATATPTVGVVSPTPEDARGALLAAMIRQQEAYPFRQSMTGTFAGCETFTGNSEYASASAFHMTISACGFDYEAILKDGQWYVKMTGGWQRLEPEFPLDITVPDVLELARNNLQAVTYAPTDTLNGMSMTVYDYRVLTDDGTEMTGRAWVGAADGLPYQMTAGFLFEGHPANFTLTFEYGVPVTVEAPIP